MSINTAATKKSSSRHRRSGAARFPARVLLSTTAVVGINSNRTAATCLTRNGATIKVSFCFKRPPESSTLFVYCPDISSFVDPDIVCSADNLLLICVNVGSRHFDISSEHCDYFVYMASSSKPSLKLLQRPHPFFHNCDVGVLPHSNGHYTIAALVAAHGDGMFKLHLFHSDTSSWSSSMVSEVPQQSPLDIQSLLNHHTTTVITIGGQLGTIGWVDLWRGILLCDVLDPKPALRFVPLPLSSVLPIYENPGEGLGYPGHCRGISFVKDGSYLKFVHIGVTGTYDEDTSSTSYRVDDWTLTTWINRKMSGSLDDWSGQQKVQASKIRIDNPAVLRVLKDTGLLHQPQDNYDAARRDLHNLLTYQPTPCDTGKDVIYLVAKIKFLHPEAWMLAVEMEGTGKLLGVGYSGSQMHQFVGSMYCPSRISKYLHPKKLKDPATADENEGVHDTFRESKLAIEKMGIMEKQSSDQFDKMVELFAAGVPESSKVTIKENHLPFGDASNSIHYGSTSRLFANGSDKNAATEPVGGYPIRIIPNYVAVDPLKAAKDNGNATQEYYAAPEIHPALVPALLSSDDGADLVAEGSMSCTSVAKDATGYSGDAPIRKQKGELHFNSASALRPEDADPPIQIGMNGSTNRTPATGLLDRSNANSRSAVPLTCIDLESAADAVDVVSVDNGTAMNPQEPSNGSKQLYVGRGRKRVARVTRGSGK